MDWQNERARLLADTIAFVQRATGDSLILAVKMKAPLSPEIEAAARHFQRHHRGPKPTKEPEMRRELRSLLEALSNMQPSLFRKHEADHAFLVARAKGSEGSVAVSAARTPFQQHQG